MRRVDGVYPLVRYATRLLNHLWAHQGAARLDQGVLKAFAGSSYNQQHVDYGEVMRGMGLLSPWQGSYRRKGAASLYRLDERALAAFSSRHQGRREVG
jgi:hypothetical protein